VLWGGYGLLGIIVGGALVSGTEALLLKGTAVWIIAEALLITAQGRQRRAFIWSWPAMLGLFFLLGIPPSPIGMLFRHLQDGLPWHWRILSVAGSVLIGAALLYRMMQKATGHVPQPWPWQRLCCVIGYTLPLLIMIILPLAEQFPNVSSVVQTDLHMDANKVNPIDKIHPYKLSWTSLGLWIVSVLGAGALAFQSTRRVAYSKSSWLQNASPILNLLDFQWFYRALWRGIEHLLSILRISAEVFEGSGALLWSFLILMLVMLVVINS
jgi:hypothetical protein